MEQNRNRLAILEGATADPASPLFFTPVVVRARQDGWTPERQRRFVAALALTGRVDRAAATVGLSQQSASRLRPRPDGESFGLACCAALTLARRASHARLSAGAKVSLGSAFFFLREAEPSTLIETSAEPSAARFQTAKPAGEGAPPASLAGRRGDAIARS
jgi:hypothetical protein